MRALAIGNFSDFLIGSFAGFYCHFGHFEYLNFRILMFRAGWTAKVSFFFSVNGCQHCKFSDLQ